jgi:integrase
MLEDLQPPVINWLYADVRANGRVRGEGPLSLKSVREVHVTLHRAFEDAVAWKYLPSNPCSRVNAPSATKARNERKKAIRTWTAEQVETFARLIADEPLFPLWLLAASTGMRRSELLGLRWPDVDQVRRLVAVRQVLVKVGGTARFKEAPKSRHGFRTIRIADRVARELESLRAEQEKVRRSVDPWEDNDLVFCRADGNPWHPDHVTKTLKELIEASALPRIRPLQDLRHSHATLLLSHGENTKVVQERLGHHSHSFTADTYQHVLPGMDEAAASRFDELVFGRADVADDRDTD